MMNLRLAILTGPLPSVAPLSRVFARPRGIPHVPGHFPQHLREVSQVPVMALLGTSVLEAAFVMRIARLLEHVLEVVDAEIQVEIVHLTGEEVELADELGAERRPVLSCVLSQIVAMLEH